MRPQVETADALIAALATRSQGVVTRVELLDAGVTPAAIKHRLEAGSLIRIHRGVYRAGHAAPSLRAGYLGAVRACGSAAVLGHAAGAYLLSIVRGEPPSPTVLAPRARQVEAALARKPNAKGAAGLRSVVHGETPVTLSRLESRFVALLDEQAMSLPSTNRPAGGRRVDCRWHAERLTVELDSYGFHNSRHAWEIDRRREREAYARGDAFRHYTWADVVEEPGPMLTELRGLLTRPRPAAVA